MVIVGEKEENERTVSVREHGQGDMGTLSITDFVTMINKKIATELE